MPRFLLASDSLKGTISSAHAAELLAEAAQAEFPGAEVRRLAVADGGEGTVEAVVAAAGGELRRVVAHGPRGAAAEASYALLGDGRALIEMAAASGLPLLAAAERDPRETSTFGTGELIADALDQGARDITLAVGGSATNDGGMGCMRALGVRFLDECGRELAGTGADLARVRSIDASGLDARVGETRFSVMCDVDNPLLGERGCARVFAPQKGATPAVVEELERGMASYAHVLEEASRAGALPGGGFRDGVLPGEGRRLFDAAAPGMGAAGGLAAATCAFLSAEMAPGIECVLDLVGFDRMLEGCDLCVTGEGHADAQSAHGKVVSGIAARCLRAGVPCVAVVGGMDADATELLAVGVDAIVPTVIDVCAIDDALARAEENYRLAASRLFSLLRIGGGLDETSRA